ncbi:MAG: caspase family protein [Microcoleaceae cyanobacterium]
MGRHSCIAIGINGYQFLQPLSYSQRDAEGLHQVLLEAGFSTDKCLLLTDSSPEIEGLSTYPSRNNILSCLDRLCDECLQPGDTLWCFFSGYGMNCGEQDYLMPIDGSSANPEETAIPMELMFERLRRSPAESVLMLLDINRSQGGRVGERVGITTMELANQMEIPTILSCRPDQLSRETSALRQGFFTATLLEGLKSNQGKSIEDLYRFLSHRLPELTEQHLRPQQDPVLVMNPSEKVSRLILPEPEAVSSFTTNLGSSSNTLGGVGPKAGDRQGQNGSALNVESMTRYSSVEQESNANALESSLPPVAAAAAAQPATQRDFDGGFGKPPSSPATPDRTENVTHSINPEPLTEGLMSDKSFLQQLILWSGLTALLLLFGVFYANRSIVLGRPSPTSQPTSQGQSVKVSPTPPSPASAPTSPAPAAKAPETQAISPVKPADSGNLSEAAISRNEATLKQARTALQSSSASNWSEAIAAASKVQKTDPLYPVAQQDIERWSQTIFDIAQGRALANNLPDAIAAAKLVPPENQAIYEQAQLQIQKWDQKLQQIKDNRAQLKAAQAKIKTGDAGSYRSAIDTARQINASQPGYAEAKQSIDQWGAAILEIAQAQAKKGRLGQAVESAALIPKDTPAYKTVQKTIAQWQARLNNQKKN